MIRLCREESEREGKHETQQAMKNEHRYQATIGAAW